MKSQMYMSLAEIMKSVGNLIVSVTVDTEDNSIVCEANLGDVKKNKIIRDMLDLSNERDLQFKNL